MSATALGHLVAPWWLEKPAVSLQSPFSRKNGCSGRSWGNKLGIYHFSRCSRFFFPLKLLGIFQGDIIPFGVVFNYLPSRGKVNCILAMGRYSEEWGRG